MNNYKQDIDPKSLDKFGKLKPKEIEIKVLPPLINETSKKIDIVHLKKKKKNKNII